MKNRRLRMPPRPVIAGSLYVYAMVVIAGVAAWPIYQSDSFSVLVAAAALTGGVIAGVSRVRGWPTWSTIVCAAVAVLVIGLFTVVPDNWTDPAVLAMSALDVARGAVTGWKDLLTVDLPVGNYRNLLVPALIVFLAGTLIALRLSWRSARIAVFAAVVALGMVFFGLAFGRTVTSNPLVLGPLSIPAPRELFTGTLGLVLSLTWLSWLSHDERRRALRRAADTSGVRLSRRRSASDRRRGVLAAVMIAVAVFAGAVAAPAVAEDRAREVLRSGVGPDLDVAQAISPLAEYRTNFADADIDDVMFTVSSDSALPERIRLATLTWYNGEVYRALDPHSSVADARFTRVPSGLDGGAGPKSSAVITIDALRGIWLPTFGRVEHIDFGGSSASALADAFYYSASSSAGVETARGGLSAGDTYTVSAVTPAVPALADISPPGLSSAKIDPPKSLVSWVEDQGLGTDGASLAELVSRLRQRGYLSHALSVPAGGAPKWMAPLAPYTFQPSASGHSLARIDALFTQLLERQTEADAQGGGASLVAGIGDQEQFAVAAALIAEQLGYPARVVVGTRLVAGDGETACADGVCKRGDLTAWIEVRSSDGAWVPVDVTPQHTESIQSELRQQRDPANVTEVRPRSAQEVSPPEPVQQDSAPDDNNNDAPIDLTSLWAAARVVALGALVLALALGPFVIVIVAKALRRRSRRVESDASAQVIGGWDEYVDVAVDHGLPAPRSETREELAAMYARPAAATLAVAADRAVFSEDRLTTAESQEFWRIVDGERRALSEDRSVWQRLRAAVSLKSFTRYPAPRSARGRAPSALRSERRMRRPDGGAQEK